METPKWVALLTCVSLPSVDAAHKDLSFAFVFKIISVLVSGIFALVCLLSPLVWLCLHSSMALSTPLHISTCLSLCLACLFISSSVTLYLKWSVSISVFVVVSDLSNVPAFVSVLFSLFISFFVPVFFASAMYLYACLYLLLCLWLLILQFPSP